MSEMDRFVEFLRRAAAEYNSPPPTPRDEVWRGIEDLVYGEEAAGYPSTDAPITGERPGEDVDPGGSDPEPDPELDGFVEFLRDAAAGYNEPPPTPRDEMWTGIESEFAPGVAGELDERTTDDRTPEDRTADDPSGDVLSAAAFLYREPPPTPRDEMWGRIEAAWQLRRSAGPDARDAGLEPLPVRPVPDLPDQVPHAERRGRDRRRALVATGLAIAASMVIGIAIGRRSAEQLRSESSPTTVAQDVAVPGSLDAAGPRTPGELASAGDPAAQGLVAGTDAQGTPAVAGQSEALETAGPEPAQMAAIEPRRLDAAVDERRGGLMDRSSRRAAAVHYATTEHLGRAEALLTTFRTDPGGANGEVSRWAGELLAETRLLLDMPANRDPRTRALLQELELFLALIAALRDDAPSSERAFVANGLDQQGTLPRLRAAMPSAPAGAWRVGT